jgi:EmrB/QacA subfamily drug resistance transporter
MRPHGLPALQFTHGCALSRINSYRAALLERVMAIGLRPPCDRGVIEAHAPAITCAANDYPWILTSTILASSMVFIDATAVNLALPVVQTELHASNAQAQWIIEAYALFLSALILVGGSLGDRLGRRRVFLWGVTGFALASALCATVRTADQLIAARALQGLASALLTPGSLAILGASIDEARRSKAIGIWSSLGALTSVAGPLIGGAIVQHASWRWIFLINVPLAIAVVAISLRWVPESREQRMGRGIDWLGAVLATFGLGSIVYALIAASFAGWTTALIWCASLGVALLVLFVLTEVRAPSPMMPLAIFASKTFSAVNLQTLALYAALGGVTFLLPFNLILIQHYSPTAAGAAFLPFVALVTLLSPSVGVLCRKIGPKIPLVVGSLVVAAAFVGFAMTNIGGSYWATYFVPTLLLGFGMALVITPLTTTVIDSAGRDRFGIASGINNAVARTASLLAVATLSLVVASTFNRQLDEQLARISLPPHILAQVNAQRPKLAAAKAPAGTPEPLRDQIQAAIDASYVSGFRQAMIVAAGLALVAALCALALPKTRVAADL